jgi:hypothetical protein
MTEVVEHYQIHSLVRKVETRHHRMLSAERHRFSMLLGGGLLRVIRRRPTTVTKGVIEKLLPELLEKEKRGMLMVTTLQGQRIDLTTLKAIEGLPPVAPMPEPPLDSAENDETFEEGVGEDRPQMPGGLPMTASVELPAVLQEQIEATPEEPVVTATVELPVTPPPPPPSVPETQTRRGRRR